MIANIQDEALPFGTITIHVLGFHVCEGNRNCMRNVQDIQHLRGCMLFETPGITEKLNFHLIYDRYTKLKFCACVCVAAFFKISNMAK